MVSGYTVTCARGAAKTIQEMGMGVGKLGGGMAGPGDVVAGLSRSGDSWNEEIRVDVSDSSKETIGR